jgi:hypothetical protein
MALFIVVGIACDPFRFWDCSASMSEFSIPNCPSVFSNVYFIFCLPNWPSIALSSLYYIPSRAASTYLPNLWFFFYLILVLSKYTIHLYVIYMYSTFMQMKTYLNTIKSIKSNNVIYKPFEVVEIYTSDALSSFFSLYMYMSFLWFRISFLALFTVNSLKLVGVSVW